MQTIINKKGNIGYALAAWNVNTCYRVNTEDFRAPQIEVLSHSSDESATTIQISISKVKVHSCGKVVMRVIELDDTRTSTDKLSGTEYDPQTPLYATLEDARLGAVAYHAELLANTRALDDADSVLKCHSNNTLELETVLYSDWIAANQYG